MRTFYVQYLLRVPCAAPHLYLSPEQKDILDKNGFTDLANNSAEILNCAVMLAMEYIQEATHYAESVGGGGGNLSGWGCDKDDDDELWWRRCISHTSPLVKPAKIKKSRGR